MNVVLAGMPGSGKTTVARLFEADGKKVYDTDKEIENRHGAITEIFAKFGEQYFRELETQAVESLSRLDGVVIATGGGCLLREENINLLKKSGKIVFLRTSPKTLIGRLQGDKTRPLLQGGLSERINELYSKRESVYESAADLIIDTDGLKPEQIVQRIIKNL